MKEESGRAAHKTEGVEQGLRDANDLDDDALPDTTANPGGRAVSDRRRFWRENSTMKVGRDFNLFRLKMV